MIYFPFFIGFTPSWTNNNHSYSFLWFSIVLILIFQLTNYSTIDLKARLSNGLSYPTGRNQHVRVGETMLSCMPIGSGVPQASLLDPIVILLFINDIASLDISGKVCLFANETGNTRSIPDITSSHRTISNDLIAIIAWCDSNLLSYIVN